MKALALFLLVPLVPVNASERNPGGQAAERSFLPTTYAEAIKAIKNGGPLLDNVIKALEQSNGRLEGNGNKEGMEEFVRTVIYLVEKKERETIFKLIKCSSLKIDGRYPSDLAAELDACQEQCCGYPCQELRNSQDNARAAKDAERRNRRTRHIRQHS